MKEELRNGKNGVRNKTIIGLKWSNTRHEHY